MREQQFIEKWFNPNDSFNWRNSAGVVYWSRAYAMTDNQKLMEMSRDLLSIENLPYSSSVGLARRVLNGDAKAVKDQL